MKKNGCKKNYDDNDINIFFLAYEKNMLIIQSSFFWLDSNVRFSYWVEKNRMRTSGKLLRKWGITMKNFWQKQMLIVVVVDDDDISWYINDDKFKIFKIIFVVVVWIIW